MKRSCQIVMVALFVFAAGAAPAFAHEEISPSTLAVGKPVFLTLTAANEKSANLTKVTLSAPQGLDFGAATRAPAGWSTTKSATTITWTGGAVPSNNFESWGFEIEGADQPGALNYKVNLAYADGTNEDATVLVTATTAAKATGSSSSGSGRADVALGLGVLALVVAGVALALASRSRAVTTTAGAPATDKGGQDW
jgi:uncharacterized protein YcnI